MNKYKATYKDMSNEDVPARQSRILGVILIALALLTVAVQTDTGEIDITAAIVIGFIGMAELLPSAD